VDVSVKCGGEPASLQRAFSYSTADEPAAAIASVDPLFGSAGQSVTITGLRFRTGDRVAFDATGATILSTTNDTHVVRIPELPLGKVAVTLTDPNGRATTTGPIFTIVEPTAPKITRATPATVVTGSELVIDGEGFRPGYRFALGDRIAMTISMTYTRATVRVPSIDPGSYPLNVINAAGNVAAIGPSITVGTSGVAVTSISVSCATTDGGGSVTIRGSSFAGGASVVFGTASATNVVVVDPQTITATIPASTSAGAARIVVTNPNGNSGSLTNAFRYTSPYDPDGCGPGRRRPGAH
jgi:hypothetical protein